MPRDAYYIRSLISFALFISAVFSISAYLIYLTGIYGLSALAMLLLLVFAYFYRWHRLIMPSRKLPKTPDKSTEETPVLKETSGGKVKL